MKIFRLLFICFILSPALNAQNLLGYSGEEIKEYMRINQKHMSLNTVNNKSFSYLKYSDSMDSRTILFHLDRDSICNNIMVICDKSSKKAVINEYNSIYKKAGENIWIDSNNRKKARVELIDGEYSSIVSIKPDK